MPWQKRRWRVKAVADVDHPGFWQSLRPHQRKIAEKYGASVLKDFLRKLGYPETRPGPYPSPSAAESPQPISRPRGRPPKNPEPQ